MRDVLQSLLLGLCACCSGMAMAGGPVTWTFATKPAGNDTVQLLLTATCEQGWHIYALALPSDEGPLPTMVQVEPQAAFRLVGAPLEPKPVEAFDPNFGVAVRYHDGAITITQPLLRKTAQAFPVEGAVEYMACNDKTCLPPRTVTFTVDVPRSK